MTQKTTAISRKPSGATRAMTALTRYLSHRCSKNGLLAVRLIRRADQPEPWFHGSTQWYMPRSPLVTLTISSVQLLSSIRYRPWSAYSTLRSGSSQETGTASSAAAETLQCSSAVRSPAETRSWYKSHNDSEHRLAVSEVTTSRELAALTVRCDIMLYNTRIHNLSVNVKYSTHGAYIEYDILNFSTHNSTSTQNALTLSTLLSTCAVVHTEIEYIILNIGAVRWVFFLLTLSVLCLQCYFTQLIRIRR